MKIQNINKTICLQGRLACVLASVFFSIAGNVLAANQEVITDDGREVLLKADGTWEFRSDDRFANTGDGQRVRLKADGSWEYMGNAPMVASQLVRTRELEIELQEVVVEIHEQKAQKNTRVSSQTVFYLKLGLSPLAEKPINIDKSSLALIVIQDNKRRTYPVLSMQASPASLKPASEASITIRADGSPQWWKNVKTMNIVFEPEIFGLGESITLTYSMDDIEKRKVDGFNENHSR
jgi:hypothetical protein